MKHLVCSPQVFWAKLWLQELEEELLSCRVLEGLLQRETPLLHPLLTGLLTGRDGRDRHYKTSTWSCCREVKIEKRLEKIKLQGSGGGRRDEYRGRDKTLKPKIQLASKTSRRADVDAISVSGKLRIMATFIWNPIILISAGNIFSYPAINQFSWIIKLH